MFSERSTVDGCSDALRLLTVAALSAVAVACASPTTYDLILRGGTIVDGTGREPYGGDVAIAGDRIATVGQLGGALGLEEIDATGLMVAPGFINIHSHARAEGLPTAVNMLSQGVTTEILNPDGAGPLDLTTQLAKLEAGGLALNVGAFIGFNSVWRETVGPDDRRPTPEQIAQMQMLVEAGLEAGVPLSDVGWASPAERNGAPPIGGRQMPACSEVHARSEHR